MPAAKPGDAATASQTSLCNLNQHQTNALGPRKAPPGALDRRHANTHTPKPGIVTRFQQLGAAGRAFELSASSSYNVLISWLGRDHKG